jgi:rhodanese-related sulfurtransferase
VTDVLPRAVKESIIILVAVLAVSLIVNFTRDEGIPLIADAEAFRVQTDADFMIAEDARVYFDEGTAIFLDARENRFFVKEHIEGAMNLPSTEANVDSLAYMVPADPALICYSSSATERQAGVIADRLLEIGFTRVYVLHGGLESWKALDLPTAKGI